MHVTMETLISVKYIHLSYRHVHLSSVGFLNGHG